MALLPPPEARKSTAALVRWAYEHWVTRSLLVGAVATGFDVAVMVGCVKGAGLPIPAGAAIGVAVGATFTFFANRHFAFRDHNPELAPQAAKFVVATIGAMLIHAPLVGILVSRAGIPMVFAKFIADILVFSVGQLLLLRYVVFPKDETEPQPAGHSQAERYPPSP